MGTQRIDLNVEARTTGKHNSRALRTKGKIPAVVYGSVESNANIFVDEINIVKYNVRKYENALFNIVSTDKNINNKVVLIKEVDVHPLTRKPRHIDFFAIDITKSVRVFVEVKLEGKPIGLSEGGLLNVVNREIEIECLPTNIPEFLTADVSNLGISQAFHVSDLVLPKEIKAISLPELTIAVVNEEDEIVVAPVAAAAPAAAAPAAGKAAAPAAGAKAAPKAPAAKK